MAQIGSFVPARSAKIGLVDHIFTRIGASDDISTGQSTFMVEMREVSYILKNATRKSLLLLDEVGRGTSTYDGLSIAWAVIEYIIDPNILYARTIFATHYHELNQLERLNRGVFNNHVEVKEEGDSVTFLHKISDGGTSDRKAEFVDMIWNDYQRFFGGMDKGMIWMNTSLADAGIKWKKED